MPIRLGRFEMPKRLTKEDSTATDTYAKFIAEPFETGYGHTVGNSLRRVLLSSLEGAAISSIKIDGAMHEFATVEGVVEDVTDIVLNLKKVLLKAHTRDTQMLLLSVNKEGEVTAGDIQLNQNVELVNPTQHICTIDKKKKFEMELEVKVGRGFMPGDENKKPNQPIGVVAIDSLFSPVTRVRYAVESARVGQRTDYDRLVLEVWTDGRISPDDALTQASAILQHHLDVFVGYDKNAVEFEEVVDKQDEEKTKLKKLLNMSARAAGIDRHRHDRRVRRAGHRPEPRRLHRVGRFPREPKGAAAPGLRSDEGATREGGASRAPGGEWEDRAWRASEPTFM